MKRILVTGATGGIGNEVSQHLARTGHEVILFARNESKLSALSQKVTSIRNSNSEPGQPQKKSSATRQAAHFHSLDLSDLKSIEKFDFASLGQIDGLVLMPPQLDPATDPFASPEEWGSHFNAGFIGPLLFLERLLPNLKKSDRAKIVFISGISSLQVLSHYATSNVLRCAWVAQAKTLAHFLGKDSIHFNTLSLGGVMTPSYEDELQEEAKLKKTTVNAILDCETNNVPLKKYATPIEIAYAIEGLLGNFTNHITGVNIAVDGGFTKAY